MQFVFVLIEHGVIPKIRIFRFEICDNLYCIVSCLIFLGVVHRNLKPEVLLCNEDATEVKISDFSMARSTFDAMNDYNVVPKWYVIHTLNI